MTHIRPFERKPLFTPPRATLPSEVKLPEPRQMTFRERRLNALANKLDSAVLIWHQDDEGDYVGFTTITPDGLRITVQTHQDE